MPGQWNDPSRKPRDVGHPASMKRRRRVVEERYQGQIDEMYAQAEAAGPGTLPNA